MSVIKRRSWIFTNCWFTSNRLDWKKKEWNETYKQITTNHLTFFPPVFPQSTQEPRGKKKNFFFFFVSLRSLEKLRWIFLLSPNSYNNDTCLAEERCSGVSDPCRSIHELNVILNDPHVVAHIWPIRVSIIKSLLELAWGLTPPDQSKPPLKLGLIKQCCLVTVQSSLMYQFVSHDPYVEKQGVLFNRHLCHLRVRVMWQQS